MKKFSVILLVLISFVFAGFAEAAKPKKRTRNANRMGAYGGALIGQSSFSGDQSENEQGLIDTLVETGNPIQNLSADTETDLGYQASFGYRFNRWFAAELGLGQFGTLESKARADMDFGDGFVPTSVSLTFSAGGLIVSGVGILPISEKFEAYARLGYLFCSSEREFASRVDGRPGFFGSAKGDSQSPVYGIGIAYHINQVYSIRGEYQMLNELGQDDRTGTEDLSVIGVGLIVRF